ncbi:hypothetical protein [Cyanothece sp. BG0011]|uniref:hypothetical protein n=1 Tax=Cyanothece sp. BG0011 TaxID=2082950 RepID=UPI000D1E546E|nr:hypothetical protein [Cyanothece sp. BG0011]
MNNSNNNQSPWTNLKDLIDKNPLIIITTIAITCFAMGWGVHETLEHLTDGKPLITVYKPIKATIIEPKNGDVVERWVDVKGELKGNLRSGEQIWLVVHPRQDETHPESHGWYPQETNISPDDNNQWQLRAIIGQEGNEDSNREFDLAVVKVGNEGIEQFKDHLDNGYPEQNLPPDAIQLGGKITVVRK